MNTLVIYDTKFGNTQRVAEAIARGVGTASDVRVMSAAEAGSPGAVANRPDLVILGGPTQNHGPSAGLRDFATALPAPLRGVPVACFDTRYRGPVLLMGSAASAVAKSLGRAGSPVVGAPESFFIGRSGQMPRQTLEAGELERAEQWGRAVTTAQSATTTD